MTILHNGVEYRNAREAFEQTQDDFGRFFSCVYCAIEKKIRRAIRKAEGATTEQEFDKWEEVFYVLTSILSKLDDDAGRISITHEGTLESSVQDFEERFEEIRKSKPFLRYLYR